MIWLFRQLFVTWPRTETIPAVLPDANASDDGECGRVVVRSDTAFVFEIKASVASLALRSSGFFSEIDNMVKKGARQAKKAAVALRAGTAVRKSDRSQIEGVRYVVPCVVTCGDVPLMFPSSDLYQRHLENQNRFAAVFGGQRHLSTSVLRHRVSRVMGGSF